MTANLAILCRTATYEPKIGRNNNMECFCSLIGVSKLIVSMSCMHDGPSPT